MRSRRRIVAVVAAIVALAVAAGFVASRSTAFRALWTYTLDRVRSTPEPIRQGAFEVLFDDPSYLWSTPDGTVYVTSRRSHTVYALSGDRIERVAGNGRRGFSGDGRAAVRARLDSPDGVVGDADGNLYIADSANHRVRRIAPDGTIETIAGTGWRGFSGDGGPASTARLDRPKDPALGPDGSLYFIDWGNRRIRRIAPDGTIETVAGTGEAGGEGDGGPALEARLDEPYGIDVDADGVLYIADSKNHRVRRVGPDGVIDTFAGTGELGRGGDGGPAIEATFDSPQEVLVTASGAIYVNDEHNHRIRRIAPDGRIEHVAGNGEADWCGDGGAAVDACLNDPEGLALDGAGNLYITDGDSHRIRRVSPDGTIETVAGSGPIGKR